ncbi:dopamine D2-like receptor [Liolophura sinensis]|uniref:dopamine D2-like receptor n=1 Tax=Liolophura sinensis TaxID=3198878 RepID=UPI003158D3BD
MNNSTAGNFDTIGYEDCEERIARASTESFQMSTLGYVIAEICLVLFLSGTNILVVIAVARFQELRTSTNIFVLSLTLSDLMVALVALPLHITIFLFPSVKIVFAVCMLRYCVIIVSCGSSIATLMLISVDRYIAIEKPYIYKRVMSKTRSKILCTAVWTYAMANGSLPLLGLNRWSPCVDCTFTLVLPAPFIAFILGHIIIAVVIIGTLNLKIFLTANAVSREIRQQIATVNREPTSDKLFLKNKKAAAALAMVFGAYAICNLPFAIFMIWEVYVLNASSSRIKSAPSSFHVFRIGTTFLSFINSGINPIIYHRRMPEFRRAFRKILRLKPETDS